MVIGLVRHYKVERGYPKQRFISQNEFFEWVKEYDSSDVEEKDVDLGGYEWTSCYSSDMDRAKTTASSIYQGNIIFLRQLREIQMYPFFKRNVTLPYHLYLILLRVAWYFNHKSQLESKGAVLKRISEVVDQVTANKENTLIISHDRVMMFMQQELMKRGFTGPKLRKIKNGELYVFEKAADAL